MKLTKQQRLITFISVSLFLLLIDFLTKKWAYDSLIDGTEINIIGDFFRFRFIWNPGSAFGILGVSRWIFLLINLVITTVFGYFFMHKTKDLKTNIAYVAIVVGGFGNMIDRFLYTDPYTNGAVVDFISIHNFPVFNLADIYVVLGTLLIIVWNWNEDKKA